MKWHHPHKYHRRPRRQWRWLGKAVPYLILILMTATVTWVVSPHLPSPTEVFRTVDNASVDASLKAAAYIEKVAGIGEPSSPEQRWYDEEVVKELYQVTNDARREQGLPLFERDPLLESLAQEHAKDMCDRRSCDHYRFNIRAERASQYDVFAENCVYISGYYDAPSLFLQWELSPLHWGNIIDRSLTHIGIGVYGGYAVQDFGG